MPLQQCKAALKSKDFQSFYNQLVSILSSVESFDEVLLDDYEVHHFADHNGAPNKALFRLLLTYVDMHYTKSTANSTMHS